MYIPSFTFTRIWKLLGLLRSSALSISCPDDIREQLPNPVSAFPFPELGGLLKPAPVLTNDVTNDGYSVKNAFSSNTPPSSIPQNAI